MWSGLSGRPSRPADPAGFRTKNEATTASSEIDGADDERDADAARQGLGRDRARRHECRRSAPT